MWCPRCLRAVAVKRPPREPPIYEGYYWKPSSRRKGLNDGLGADIDLSTLLARVTNTNNYIGLRQTESRRRRTYNNDIEDLCPVCHTYMT